MKQRMMRVPDGLGELLVRGVQRIDKDCCMIRDGMECGLYNVREQFAREERKLTSKKLTEEPLISWLLHRQLSEEGICAELECPYPGTDERCDLTIDCGDARFAVEVKIAWMKYVWTDGSVKRSSNFRGYLLGDATHPGAAHDFRKLQAARWATPTWLGVLLVGFDTFRSPMHDRVGELERQGKLGERGWRLVSHVAWPDRKDESYRLACWFWARPPGN